MRRLTILAVAAALPMFLVAGPVSADTTTGHDVMIPIDDPENPCQPAVGVAWVNIVDHFSVAANGSAHGTHTETGNFVLTGPGDIAGATGHYTFWGGFNANSKQFGFWFTLRAKGTKTDGSTFQFNLMGQERAGPNSFGFVQFNCHDGGPPMRGTL